MSIENKESKYGGLEDTAHDLFVKIQNKLFLGLFPFSLKVTVYNYI